MQPLRVAVLDDYQGVARSALRNVGVAALIDCFGLPEHTTDEDTLVSRLAPFDVVVVMRERTPMTASLLARLAPKLKLLITTGGHNASIDLAACERLGIAVGGTPGHAPATAELTWALLLALARKIPIEDANVRAGRWQTTVGGDLEGKTLGIIGLGKLGQRVAKIAAAFGMKVVAWSQNLTDEAAQSAGVERAASVINLCTRAD